MSVAKALAELIGDQQHDLAIELLRLHKQQQAKPQASAPKLVIENPKRQIRTTSRKEIRSATEIRRLIRLLLQDYKPGSVVSVYQLHKMLHSYHDKHQFFTEADLTLDSRGLLRWKSRASRAVQQLRDLGVITSINTKCFRVEA
jgi:hypothetical protein